MGSRSGVEEIADDRNTRSRAPGSCPGPGQVAQQSSVILANGRGPSVVLWSDTLSVLPQKSNGLW